MGLTIAPGFALINTGEPALFLAASVLVFGVAMSPAAGVTGSLFSLAFDGDVRYSGVSIGYTLSQLLGSAFAPTIALPCTPQPRRALRSSPIWSPYQ